MFTFTLGCSNPDGCASPFAKMKNLMIHAAMLSERDSSVSNDDSSTV